MYLWLRCSTVFCRARKKYAIGKVMTANPDPTKLGSKYGNLRSGSVIGRSRGCIARCRLDATLTKQREKVQFVVVQHGAQSGLTEEVGAPARTGQKGVSPGRLT